MLKSKKAAFTLSETLIVIATLGIVAVTTVPILHRSYTERADRVKIQKAVAQYENFVRRFVVENNITSGQKAVEIFNAARPKTCNIFLRYFSIKKINSNSTIRCEFETNDGLIWRFSRESNALVNSSNVGIATNLYFKDRKNIRINNQEVVLPYNNTKKINYFHFYFYVDPATKKLYINDPEHVPWVHYPGVYICQMTAGSACTTTAKELDATSGLLWEYLKSK